MFVSKVNDVLICEDIAYKVQNQFVYNNEEYLILMSMIGKLEDVITNSASIYVAKEILSEDETSYSIDIIEDEKLIDEILDFYFK